MRYALTACVRTAAHTLAGCGSTPPHGAAAGGPVTIEGLYEGPISGVDQPGVSLITSTEQLQSLQSATLAAIPVDFSKQALVVLALGEQPTGGYWARITGVRVDGNALVVRGLANRPAPDAMVTQALTTPYCAAVISPPGAATVRSEIESVVGQQPPPHDQP